MNEEKYNIVKVRDDKEPIKFLMNNETGNFDLVTQENIDWCSGSSFTKSELRTHIEPWLTSLFQSEHLSLLVGSGLTTAIQYAACDESNNGMKATLPFSVFANSITKAANDSAIRTGRQKANIEDQIRVANQLITGLSVLKDDADFSDLSSKLEMLSLELDSILKSFTDNIFAIEHSIVSSDAEKRVNAFNRLVMFLMSFASRTGTRDRLNIFTTNYDRLIEAGADVAGLRLIDRFVGALTPVFRSSRIDVDMHYNPPGIRGEPRYLEGVARFTKLHGSLDWINVGNDIRRIGLPFGAKTLDPFLDAAGLSTDYSSLMIYPNSAKDRETAEYPYVELFRDFAAALCRPNSTLVTYGYSFGDDHINRVIRDMLTISSTHLVVIDYDDATGRIIKSFKQWGHQSQMSLIIGKDIANIDALVDYYLPKPSIDRASIRMADILKQRFNQPAKNEREGEPSE